MAYRYQKHYTRDEARALLPTLRQWLDRLNELRVELEKTDRKLSGLMGNGRDMGGDLVNGWARLLSNIKDLLQKFAVREIIIKDMARGLVDFPAVIGGREVFLCWERDEEDIEFWHDLDSGYAGRERL